MIVRPAPDGGLLLVRQTSHARMAARFADEWGWSVPRAEETRRAVEIHDNGWAEWDEAPRVDDEGRPFDYMTIPTPDYVAVWRRGFERAWLEGSWAGLVVSLHGSSFVERRQADAGAAALVAQERALRASGMEWLKLEAAEAGRDGEAVPREALAAFGLLRHWDALSLFLVEEWPGPWTGDVPTPTGPRRVTATRVAPREVALDPWPFGSEEVGARVAAFHLPQARYATDAKLQSALEDAEVRTLAWTLKPAPARVE